MRGLLSYALLAALMVASTFVIGNLAASYDRQLYTSLDERITAALAGGSGGHYWEQR